MDPLKDLPLGFGMALIQNETALLCFDKMSEAQKRELLARTHDISSKAEMRAFVDEIAAGIRF